MDAGVSTIAQGDAPGAAQPTAAEEGLPASESQRITRDIAVVGASSGGVQALQQLAAALPEDFAGAVLVVMHVSPEAHSVLPSILARSSRLPAVAADDGMAIERGRIHVARPDCHLLVEGERLRVIQGPRENRHRPAIDPLFRSAAWAYGPRVVGVVLTGNLDDGTAGLWAIKSCGGVTIVQEPDEASHPQMPINALMHNRIDHRLRLDEIAQLLVRLAREATDPGAVPPPPSTLKDEIEFAMLNRDIRSAPRLGALSPFTCPSCRGALWELEEGGHLRYRCHTGHAYSAPSLLIDQDVMVEESMYAALKALEEKAGALRRLAERWPDNIPALKQDYEERARKLDESAEVLRALLTGAKA